MREHQRSGEHRDREDGAQCRRRTRATGRNGPGCGNEQGDQRGRSPRERGGCERHGDYRDDQAGYPCAPAPRPSAGQSGHRQRRDRGEIRPEHERLLEGASHALPTEKPVSLKAVTRSEVVRVRGVVDVVQWPAVVLRRPLVSRVRRLHEQPGHERPDDAPERPAARADADDKPDRGDAQQQVREVHELAMARPRQSGTGRRWSEYRREEVDRD